MTNKGSSTALYVMSHDLRVEDNHALAEAAKHQVLIVVYCVDPRWFSPGRYGLPPIGPLRWRFIFESLKDISESLASSGQKLNLVFGDFVEEISEVINQVAPDVLICSRPQGWFERKVLLDLAKQFDALPIRYADTYTLLNKEDGSWLGPDLLMQFTPFRKLAEQQNIRKPIPAPVRLPPMSSTALGNNLTLSRLDEQIGLDRDESLIEPETSNPFKGGESEAKKHLAAYFVSDAPSSYKETRNELSGWQNSTKFSCWLNQGCISPRQLLDTVDQYEIRHGANESTYWIKVELLWREYFQWLAPKIGLKLFSFKGLRKPPLTSFYPERFRRWCSGNTPYPLVNACMQELASTGYMSNRGRQIVASCLVNELKVDWRYGAAWFENQLIDYDVASNWGNWQYIAGVGVDPRGGRHFNLQKQQEQFDPNFVFIKKWLGEDFLPKTPKTADSVDAADWPIFDV